MSEPVRGSGRNITGAEYVSAITSRESDRRARAAFRARALELVPAGGTIFDFGAGPGLDARFYAEHGRRVGAYDVDPQMCRYFADYCDEQIGKGLIRLHQGSYAQFLGSTHGAARVDLITANFAPLNLIDDLKALFAAFAALTQADGRVLASVLSPYFVGDLRYRWWWRNLTQLRRTGRFSVPGAQALIWRRRLADFAAESAPHFTLERVFAGTSPWPSDATVSGVAADAPAAWVRLIRCRYMFLLFRRSRAPASAAGNDSPV